LSNVKVIIPAVMASATKGDRAIDITGVTVAEVVSALSARYGEPFKRRVLDTEGKPRHVLNLYVNGKNVKFLNNLETVLVEGDELMLLPAVSGG